MIRKAQSKPRWVVFPEGEESKILRACQILVDEEIARPILLGDNARIRAKIAELHLHLEDVLVVEPASSFFLRRSSVSRAVLAADHPDF